MIRTILVTGATGNQGGAVADALLAGNWRVRALTRDPGSEKARRLLARGAEVVKGDLADPAEALKGAYGVFSVQNTRTAGLEGEVRQGIALADAAKKEGVQHFVYSSVGGVERVRGIPHFDTKWEIEQHIRNIGLPYTFLRPTAFMTMFNGIGLGMLAAVLGKDKRLQLVAVSDIGVFARLAFDDPATYLGRELELAGDELTVPEIAERLGKRYVRLPKALLRAMGKESRMLFWFGESGYRADIAALRQLHPGLLRLEGS